MTIKNIQSVLMLAAVGTLAGCGVSPSQGSEAAPSLNVGTTAQAVTLTDCQKQAATCVQAAKSFAAVGACTTTFTACSVQAAKDAVGQPNLLANCTSKANSCLDGAVTLSDITACRTVYDACASDIVSTAGDALTNAVSTAKSAIDKATQVALTTLQDASGVASSALDAVGACESTADSCIKGALSVTNVSSCQDIFETCLGGAVTVADKAVGDLPVPTPSQVATDFTACQKQATSCLDGAVSITDISACKGTLQTCVNGATTVVDQTVADINSLLPPIIQLPTATGALTCSQTAAQCLLTPGANPVTCATQATTCLGQ